MRINDRQFIKTENDRTNESKKAETKKVAVASKQTTSTTATSATDTVKFSSRARDVAEIAQQLKESSEVREERVSELRAKIKSGEYHIDSMDIAKGIMDRAVNKVF